jgi:hypothetical protein
MICTSTYFDIVGVKVSVKEPSYAVNAGMTTQTEGRLHPQLALWLVGWLVS